MFARPIFDRKQSHKKKSIVQKPKKQASKIKSKGVQQSEKNINKIASIRTLPAFYQSQNSNRKSNQMSDNASEIWKEQYYLFQSTQKQSIQVIDKQLEDVLDTIRMQRNLIDMKIWKLKAKIHELHNRNLAKKRSNSLNQLCEIGTQTQGRQQSIKKLQKVQMFTQTQDPNRVSDYFKQYANQLGLADYKDINNEQRQKVQEEIKVVQNKKILQMLLDKISNL